MKRGFATVLLVITALLATAGAGSTLATASPDKARVVDERIDKMLERLSRKSYSNDREYLHSLFNKTQREFLHRYRQYSSLDELASGDFDCLTATSLFVEILDRAAFQYRIMETNYHIFLVVNTSEGDVLIETTDRFDGFVTSPDEISRKIAGYRNETPSEATSSTTYKYSFNLYNEVGPQQLSGLLYFNQAVKAYNEGQLLLCSEKIVLAENYCNSPRISALASVLLSTISVSDVPAEEKLLIIENLKHLQVGGKAIASR